MNTPSHSPLSAGVAAAVLFFTAFPSLDAADRTWRNPDGGAFSNAGNWLSGLIPGTLDVANFGVSADFLLPTYTVSFSANATNQALKVQDDFVVFDLNTRTYRTTAPTGNAIGTRSGQFAALSVVDGTWDLAQGSELVLGTVANATGFLTVDVFGNLTGGQPGGTNNLIIGQAGRGNFTVQNGGIAHVDSARIANLPGSTGAATVSGASQLTTGSFIVGAAGTGTFTINGAQMDSGPAIIGLDNGSDGTATLVDGQWQLGAGGLSVGSAGMGHLNITSSGLVLNSNGLLGDQATGEGTAIVDGAGSAWVNSALFHVGNFGDGTLNIKNGGRVNAVGVNGASIAKQANSKGLATVSTGSIWGINGVLHVGERGEGFMNIESGGRVENADGFIGSFAKSSGLVPHVSVDGAGSLWNNFGDLTVGREGKGELTISGAGEVRSRFGLLGNSSGGDGVATVKGAGSLWRNFESLSVGAGGKGKLEISDGGLVETDGFGVIGDLATGDGTVLVKGADSQGTHSKWNIKGGFLNVGFSGKGTMEITAGGQVQTSGGLIGGGEGTVTVSDPGSLFDNRGPLTIGDDGLGTMEVKLGGEVRNTGATIGALLGGANTITVKDSGSLWDNSGELIVGYEGSGELRIEAGGRVENTSAVLGRGPSSIGIVTVSNAGSLWENSGALTVGNRGKGTLQILNGGHVNSGTSHIGLFSSPAEVSVIVRGENSQWIVDGLLDAGGALIEIRDGGDVRTGAAFAGSITPGSDGNCLIIVEGAGSTWDTESLTLGSTTGKGVLTIDPGGVVNISRLLLTLGFDGDATLNLNGGEINLGDAPALTMGSINFTAGTFRITHDYLLDDSLLDSVLGSAHTIGPLQHFAVAGKATMETPLFLNGGTFSAGSLVPGSPLFFNSGTFNLTSDNLVIGPGGLFGDTLSLGDRNVNVTNTATIQSGARLQMQGGKFSAGTLINQGTIDFQDQSSLVSGGLLTNTGTIRGSGTILNPIQNNTAGKIQTTSGQRLEVGGTVNNAGQISLVGGQMQFNAAVTNTASTGTISVRDAIIRFEGGLTNNGSLAASFGTADILGDITNGAGTGRIVVSGNSDATFYGDLLNSGTVQVSTGSTAVWFGSVSGAGSFPGGGANFFEGDLAPGASPALITFGGDVSFGFFNTLTMELGGAIRGSQYDSLSIAGSMAAGGKLDVQLIAGFVPQQGQSFDLFDAGAIGGVFPFLSLPGLPAGLTWDISRLYSDGIIRVIPGGLTFSAWAAANGIPGATPGGDHDSDGNDNATEFALGLFPPQPGTVLPNGGLHLYNDGERLRVLFTRPLDRTGVTLKVQASNNLTLWEDLAVSVDSEPFTGPGFVSENRAHPLSDPGLVEVRDILTTSTALRRQMRLSVSIAP